MSPGVGTTIRILKRSAKLNPLLFLLGIEQRDVRQRRKFRRRSAYLLAAQSFMAFPRFFLTGQRVNYHESCAPERLQRHSFNHESPRRGGDACGDAQNFARAVAAIKRGRKKELFRNLEAKRDWVMRRKRSRDVQMLNGRIMAMILSSRLTRRIQRASFARLLSGMLDLTGRISSNMTRATNVSAEVDILIGNAAKAKKILGWQAKTRFNELVRLSRMPTWNCSSAKRCANISAISRDRDTSAVEGFRRESFSGRFHLDSSPDEIESLFIASAEQGDYISARTCHDGCSKRFAFQKIGGAQALPQPGARHRQS